VLTSAVGFSDTSVAADQVQIEVLRKLSGERTFLIALEMSEFARELARGGIRDRHPEWSEQQVTRELIRLAFFPQEPPLPLR
jgi:hypothetical protein